MTNALVSRSRRACSALVLALALLAGAVAGMLHLAEPLPGSVADHSAYFDGAADPGAESHHKCALCIAAPVYAGASATPPAAAERHSATDPIRILGSAHPAPASSNRHARAPPSASLT